MALADVLQWVDSSCARALVSLERPGGGNTWLYAEDRMVVAASAPLARGQLATDGTPAAPGPGLLASTFETLLDLFLSSEGKFELFEGAEKPPDAVPVDRPVQFLVMEGLRHLDEWPRLAETYPRDEARLAATDAPVGDLDAVQSAIYRLSLDAPTLAEARLVLGVSRAALLRRVDELRQRGLVDVEGTPHGPDLEGSLFEQSRVLLRERQYAEAAHVFRSLLATNPSDVRARRLLAEAERLQVEAAYERFSPTDIVSQVAGMDAKLRGADQAVIECLTRPRSVAVLVLVSPLRELETLSALQRLVERGVIAVEAAD